MREGSRPGNRRREGRSRTWVVFQLLHVPRELDSRFPGKTEEKRSGGKGSSPGFYGPDTWAQKGWVTCPRSHSKHTRVDWMSLSRLLAHRLCLESLGVGPGGMKAAPCAPQPPDPSSLCPWSWQDLLAIHCGRDGDNQSWPWTPLPSISQAWRQEQTPAREWKIPEVREVSCARCTLQMPSGKSPLHVPGVLGAEAMWRSPHLTWPGAGLCTQRVSARYFLSEWTSGRWTRRGRAWCWEAQVQALSLCTACPGGPGGRQDSGLPLLRSGCAGHPICDSAREPPSSPALNQGLEQLPSRGMPVSPHVHRERETPSPS